MAPTFVPTRLEAGLHVGGIACLVGFVGSMILAPWTAAPAILFAGAALALGLMYTMGMQRRTGRSWWRALGWDAMGDAAQLWRYIYSPSGVRGSLATLRGKHLET